MHGQDFRWLVIEREILIERDKEREKEIDIAI
jgi:hypothetical protein